VCRRRWRIRPAIIALLIGIGRSPSTARSPLGQRDADDAHATERRADVREYADQFIKMGVNSADDRIDDNWDDVDRSERAVIVAALKEATRRDRRFGELLARWRAESRGVSDREEPYVPRELKEKGMLTLLPR
jgi:hypothetical protein